MRHHLEYMLSTGKWLRVASYNTAQEAREAHDNSAVIHKRVVHDVDDDSRTPAPVKLWPAGNNTEGD